MLARCAAVVTALVLLSGCAAEEGHPAPAPAPSTTSAHPARPSAPPVTEPIDLSRFGVCDLIGPADVGIVGYDPDVQMALVDDECHYIPNMGGTGGMVITVYRDVSPLVSAYEQDAPTYEKFKPWDFRGYPGVVEAETIDGGVCIVVIGMADDQGVMVLKYPDVGHDPEDIDGPAAWRRCSASGSWRTSVPDRRLRGAGTTGGRRHRVPDPCPRGTHPLPGHATQYTKDSGGHRPIDR